MNAEYLLEIIKSDVIGQIYTNDYITNINQSKFYFLTISDLYSRYSKFYVINSLSVRNFR